MMGNEYIFPMACQGSARFFHPHIIEWFLLFHFFLPRFDRPRPQQQTTSITLPAATSISHTKIADTEISPNRAKNGHMKLHKLVIDYADKECRFRLHHVCK
jgi:hypothetical protein